MIIIIIIIIDELLADMSSNEQVKEFSFNTFTRTCPKNTPWTTDGAF